MVVVDAQTFLIPRFSYDGQAPDAHFWVGQGKPGPEGNFVADENGSSEPLRSYKEKTLVIVLPGDLTVFDIGTYYIYLFFELDKYLQTFIRKTRASNLLGLWGTSHSAYVATSTESDGAKIDGFLYPNFM